MARPNLRPRPKPSNMARPNLRPKPKPSKAPFPFLALPAELRLQIYNYLLLSVSTSYYYLPDGPPGPRLRRRGRRHALRQHALRQHALRQHALRQHGMLLANRQLHAEYAQAFYERTSFYFYVSADNGTRPATPFWTLPPTLLPNLRRCKLIVELGMLALVPGFSMEALAARIEALLGCMERVRRVDLKWDHNGMAGEPMWDKPWEKQMWEKQMWRLFAERSVQRLKVDARMRGTTVTIMTCITKLERMRVGLLELQGHEVTAELY